jgi:catechol-2,3-dioxygenase
VPKLQLKRVILFARDLETLTAFYRDVIGLEIRSGSPKEGWVDFGTLALHRGTPRPGSTKISFHSSEVRKTREELVKRGATFGKVKDFGDLALCDGKDPEGNLTQLSNRP